MVQENNKLAFMYIKPKDDPTPSRNTLGMKPVEFFAIGVADYDEAVRVTKELVKEGVTVIELCGGFGNIGAGKVTEAAKGVHVGMVRFDMHPVLNGKTGDQRRGLIP